jgi:hypothetical protein
MRKSQKIIKRLGGDPYGDRYPDKPKHMHWKTYHRLIAQAEYYNHISWHRLSGLLAKIGYGSEAFKAL